jgi:hypothetical protein
VMESIFLCRLSSLLSAYSSVGFHNPWYKNHEATLHDV